jgi:hypothetical protein
MSSSVNHRSAHLGALALCWIALLVAAAGASAATATFSASFEAERYAEWDQPRGVDLTDCHGQHYYAANGDDKASIKTRRPFKVTVTRAGRGLFWQFGDLPTPHDPLSYGVEAHGVSTRNLTVISGTTGGWCGGAQTNAAPATDCGTRLPVYQVALSAGPREIAWSASFAQRAQERFDFYNCPLTVPDGMHVGSFPTLPAKINRAALFSRSKRPIVITASKDYGPTSIPLPNVGVERTSHGRVSWKLKLIRIR